MIAVDDAEDLVLAMRSAAMQVVIDERLGDLTDDDVEVLRERIGQRLADALRPYVEGQQ